MTRVAAKLTYREYLLLPEDGKRYEIMEGELYVTPAPSPRHQLILARLLYTLMKYLEGHPVGTVLMAPCDVVFSETDILQPDLVFLREGGNAFVTERAIQGPPALVVEILSPGTAARDRELKQKRYEHFGVSEYWMLDLDLSTVEILRLESGQYHRHSLTARPGMLTSPLFPDLALPLDWLFR